MDDFWLNYFTMCSTAVILAGMVSFLLFAFNVWNQGQIFDRKVDKRFAMVGCLIIMALGLLGLHCCHKLYIFRGYL